MCDVTAAVQGGQAVMQYQAEREKVNAANAAANASITSGRKDYNYKSGVAQGNYQLDARAQNQTEFDTILANRAARSTAIASAASQGVTGKSVDATINAIIQQGARNTTRVKDQEIVLDRAYEAEAYGMQKNMEQVIASNPLQAAPNPLGVALGIGGATAGANDRMIDTKGTGFLPSMFG